MSRSAWLKSLSDESFMSETRRIALLQTNNTVNYFLFVKERQINNSEIGKWKSRLIHFSMTHSTLIIKAQCIGSRMITFSELFGLGLLSFAPYKSVCLQNSQRNWLCCYSAKCQSMYWPTNLCGQIECLICQVLSPPLSTVFLIGGVGFPICCSSVFADVEMDCSIKRLFAVLPGLSAQCYFSFSKSGSPVICLTYMFNRNEAEINRCDLCLACRGGQYCHLGAT